jgi:hypothetical protein
MIQRIADMPEGTRGIEAIGEVTADDYEPVLAPAVREALGHGKVRLLDRYR